MDEQERSIPPAEPAGPSQLDERVRTIPPAEPAAPSQLPASTEPTEELREVRSDFLRTFSTEPTEELRCKNSTEEDEVGSAAGAKVDLLGLRRRPTA